MPSITGTSTTAPPSWIPHASPNECALGGHKIAPAMLNAAKQTGASSASSSQLASAKLGNVMPGTTRIRIPARPSATPPVLSSRKRSMRSAIAIR